MRFYAYHGVMKQEQAVGAEFEVSVWVDYDFSQAIESDTIEDTIDYSSICDIVRKEMAIPSRLLEHAAGRIAKAIYNTYHICREVKVRLAKVNPPMGIDCDGAGVEVVFSEQKGH